MAETKLDIDLDVNESSNMPVRFRVGAPRSAVVDEEFSVRFVAYPLCDEPRIAELLRGVDETAVPRQEFSETRWAKGTSAAILCRGESLMVDPPSKQITWEGHAQHLDYDLRVAPGTPIGVKTRIKFDVVVDGIIVAALRVSLDVIDADDARGDRQEVTADSARTAFASYASEDRARVLDRVASVRTAAGLDVWMDCVNLRPNERWRELLGPKIAEQDVFLLFWSESAAGSPWVDWEWRTAHRVKGVDFMQLHPLNNDPKSLPTELKELHGTDPLMDIRFAEAARRKQTAQP